MADLVREVEALVKENAELREAVARARMALNPQPILLSNKRGRPFKATAPKRVRKAKAKAEVSRVQQGPSRRGRKEKFDHATQLAMAKAKAGGATFKALASEYKASIPTIMRAISRVNGEAHA